MKTVLQDVKPRRRSVCKALGGPLAPPGAPASGAGPVQLGSARRRLVAGGALAASLAGLTGWLAGRDAHATTAAAPDGRPPLTGRAPALFIGHGSPMNALHDNAFTRRLQQWGHEIGQPRAILMVSAHWLTEREVKVSTTARPPMIYDFGGFPGALYAQQYPAPGAPEVALRAARVLGPRPVGVDSVRGLDHGAWTVLKFLYPAADVPVFQLSIDINQAGAFHHAIGRQIASLRDEGVLIVGSGNIVHNLRATMSGQADSAQGLSPWAEGFDQMVKQALDAGDAAALMRCERLGPHAAMAVPFPDHYFPLLYALGAAQAGERARHVFEGFQAGTLSMRCLQFG